MPPTYTPPAATGDGDSKFPTIGRVAYNEASHGFKVGNIIDVSGGAPILSGAQANAPANCDGRLGIVSAVADVNNLTVQFEPGEVAVAAADKADVFETGYSPSDNDGLWLSATEPGKLTASQPTGGTSRAVYVGEIADDGEGVGDVIVHFKGFGAPTLPG